MKVLVVGIDGGTPDILFPLAKKGKCKFFGEIMKKGVWGELESTLPYITPAAWTSFSTGNLPDKHSIFGFERIVGKEKKDINRLSIKSKTIWDFLSEEGKKSIVINLPLTYPPKKDPNIITCCGMFTPLNKCFAYPPKLLPFLKKMGYVPGPGGTIKMIDQSYLFDKSTLPLNLFTLMKKRKKIAIELMKRYEWDFFFVKFMGIEILQDRYFKERRIMEEAYKLIDNIVSELFSVAMEKYPDIILIVISDHGHRKSTLQINLNRLLKKFLGEKLNFSERMKDGFYKIFERLLNNKFTGKVASVLPLRLTKYFLLKFGDTRINSKVTYLFDFRGVFIGSEEKKKLKELVKWLKSLRDKKTGKKIFRRVVERERVYKGPYAKEAPDILLDPNEDFLIVDVGPAFTKPAFTCGHRRKGILLIYGKGIRKKKLNAKIIDIAPTVLSILKVSLPKMDGKPLKILK